MMGPLISSETIVSTLLICSAATLTAAAAIPSARQLANLCRRLTPMQVVVLLTAVSIATASAQKSGTNIVEGASNTNDVAIVLNTNGVDIVEGTNEVGGVALNAPRNRQPTKEPLPCLRSLGDKRPCPERINIFIAEREISLTSPE